MVMRLDIMKILDAGNWYDASSYPERAEKPALLEDPGAREEVAFRFLRAIHAKKVSIDARVEDIGRTLRTNIEYYEVLISATTPEETTSIFNTVQLILKEYTPGTLTNQYYAYLESATEGVVQNARYARSVLRGNAWVSGYKEG